MKNNILQKQKNIQIFIWTITIALIGFVLFLTIMLVSGVTNSIHKANAQFETPMLKVVGGDDFVYLSWSKKSSAVGYAIQRQRKSSVPCEDLSSDLKNIIKFFIPKAYSQGIYYCDDGDFITPSGGGDMTEYTDYININNSTTYRYVLKYNNGLTYVDYLTSDDVTPDSTLDIYGRVFFDLNGDEEKGGVLEEFYVKDVSVKLFNSSGIEIDSITTDSNGFYHFEGALFLEELMIEVDPKILLEGDVPDTNEENNLYVENQTTFNFINDGTRLNIGLLSLNVDQKGVWENNLNIGSGDFIELIRSTNWGSNTNSQTENAYMDLDYNNRISSGDLIKILSPKYFGFPNL